MKHKGEMDSDLQSSTKHHRYFLAFNACLHACGITLKTLIWQLAECRCSVYSPLSFCLKVSIWIRNGTPFSPPCFRGVNSVLMQWTFNKGRKESELMWNTWSDPEALLRRSLASIALFLHRLACARYVFNQLEWYSDVWNLIEGQGIMSKS